ncbi:MAG: hypothetical protein WBN92_03605 [Terriglobia bacterium]
MRIKRNSGSCILMLLGMVLMGLLSVAAGAEVEKVVKDSMKRFSVKAPASWKVAESADGSSITIVGEEASFTIYPSYRGNDLEALHRRMALQFATRALEGPPKNNKIKWEKRRVGNEKALESVYEIKGGSEDTHEKYRVHVITLDGEKHKFTIVFTLPLELADKNGLEGRLMKMVEGFSEAN